MWSWSSRSTHLHPKAQPTRTPRPWGGLSDFLWNSTKNNGGMMSEPTWSKLLLMDVNATKLPPFGGLNWGHVSFFPGASLIDLHQNFWTQEKITMASLFIRMQHVLFIKRHWVPSFLTKIVGPKKPHKKDMLLQNKKRSLLLFCLQQTQLLRLVLGNTTWWSYTWSEKQLGWWNWWYGFPICPVKKGESDSKLWSHT